MDIPSLWGLYTLLLMVLFVIIGVWAWSSKRKKGFEEAAHLPFADETKDSEEEPRREHKEKQHD